MYVGGKNLFSVVDLRRSLNDTTSFQRYDWNVEKIDDVWREIKTRKDVKIG